MKGELEICKNNLSLRVEENNDIKAELRALKDVSEHRAIDLERFRVELQYNNIKKINRFLFKYF